MVCDHPVARLDVGSLEHDLDVIERHLQVAETADDLCLYDLLCGIAPVPAVHVHLDRLQQAELVVVGNILTLGCVAREKSPMGIVEITNAV